MFCPFLISTNRDGSENNGNCYVILLFDPQDIYGVNSAICIQELCCTPTPSHGQSPESPQSKRWGYWNNQVHRSLSCHVTIVLMNLKFELASATTTQLFFSFCILEGSNNHLACPPSKSFPQILKTEIVITALSQLNDIHKIFFANVISFLWDTNCHKMNTPLLIMWQRNSKKGNDVFLHREKYSHVCRSTLKVL